MTIAKVYILMGLIAAWFLYWLTRASNAAKVGAAVSQAAVDMTTGAIQGAATVIGVPMTNAEKCQKAIADRDSWGVSEYCDLATFLKYEKDALFSSDVSQIKTGTENTAPAPVALQ